MKQDKFIPNAPVFANLRNRGLTIFEPRLNYSMIEYNDICKRRQKYNK